VSAKRRYVVDAGRSKERDFDRANGVSKYEVRWISKASANQRAGRAGRTGPGHCYRLYSSAIYNNTFPQFAPPEISRLPIEGVVLLMKRMGINKVVNFPFPTAPEPAALIEAEKCLHALFALDSDTGMLTPTGQAMAEYPISPRHARMLLAALHAAWDMEGKGDRKGARVVAAFAVAAAAAMSLENPFLREIGIGEEDALSSTLTQAGGNPTKKGSAASSKDTNTMRQITKEAELESDDGVKLSKREDEDWTEADKVRRKQRRAAANRAHSRFRNVHSDPLSIVNALWAYEKAENRDEFSELHYLHAKTMQEMANLRQQLSKLVIQHGCDAEAQLIGKIDDQRASHLTKDFLVESAKTWQDLDNHTLSQEQETVLQQAICAGWADRVSRRLSAQERAQQADGKHRKAIRSASTNIDCLFSFFP
jgi:ATP-dependent RNA helicase DHX37/DHR1